MIYIALQNKIAMQSCSMTNLCMPGLLRADRVLRDFPVFRDLPDLFGIHQMIQGN